MSRRHDEAPWEERVARFLRAPRRVVSLDLLRRVEVKPEPKPDTEKKESTP